LTFDTTNWSVVSALRSDDSVVARQALVLGNLVPMRGSEQQGSQDQHVERSLQHGDSTG
jgi:hypothetical protein